jgi:hypothetical protein
MYDFWLINLIFNIIDNNNNNNNNNISNNNININNNKYSLPIFDSKSSNLWEWNKGRKL